MDKLENEREDSIPTLTWNNEVAVTDKEKAVMIHKAIEAKQKRVENKLGNPKGDPMEILVNNIDKKDAFYIREFSEFEVYNAIKSVANKGSSGDDQISYVMLKYIKHFVSKPLLSIINQSIRTGYFPSDWKKTIVSPILKAGKDKTSPESYRPVSLLSALSRIMELMIAGEMDRYAEGSEILPDATHGYRKNRSTVTALLEVTSDIIEGYDSNQLLSFTALDISAGFDTVASSYLLRTLELQGYSEQALKWFDSYLDSRCWRVKVNSHYSEWGTIPKGIPQGGPMSPPLFREFTMTIPMTLDTKNTYSKNGHLKTITDEKEIITEKIGPFNYKREIPITNKIEEFTEKPAESYLNNRIVKKIEGGTANLEDFHDLKINNTKRHKGKKKKQKEANCNLYADDSGTRKLFRSLGDLKKQTPKILQKLFDQMRAARLLVNSDKTVLTVFGDTKKKNNELKNNNITEIKIKVENTDIKEQNTNKLLGVTLDAQFSFQKHISSIRSTIQSKLIELWKVADMLTFEQRKQAASAKLLSILYYCVEIVTQTSENMIKQMRMILSSVMKWVINRPNEEWSRTQGLIQTGWRDVDEVGLERSIMTARRVIISKQSNKLFDSLVRDNKIIVHEIDGTTKQKKSRSWEVRSCRFIRTFGTSFLNARISNESAKKIIRKIIKENKDDALKIFNGKRTERQPNSQWI